MSATDIVGLLARRYPKCGTPGPDGEPCGLEPGHDRWHASSHRAWHNADDAAVGRRILAGEVMALSYNEFKAAMEAAEADARQEVTR